MDRKETGSTLLNLINLIKKLDPNLESDYFQVAIPSIFKSGYSYKINPFENSHFRALLEEGNFQKAIDTLSAKLSFMEWFYTYELFVLEKPWVAKDGYINSGVSPTEFQAAVIKAYALMIYKVIKMIDEPEHLPTLENLKNLLQKLAAREERWMGKVCFVSAFQPQLS